MLLEPCPCVVCSEIRAGSRPTTARTTNPPSPWHGVIAPDQARPRSQTVIVKVTPEVDLEPLRQKIADVLDEIAVTIRQAAADISPVPPDQRCDFCVRRRVGEIVGNGPTVRYCADHDTDANDLEVRA